MGALRSLAIVMATSLHTVHVLPMSTQEAQECFLDWELDNMDMILLSGGQGILPGLSSLVAEWECCSSDRYRKDCGRNRRQHSTPRPSTTTAAPRPITTTAVPQTVMHVSEAVEAGKAMAKNTLRELASFRSARTDDWEAMDHVHWGEIQSRRFGAFCARDESPKVATTDAQRRTQQENRLEWQVCWCSAYCQTWLVSSKPDGSLVACHQTLRQYTFYETMRCSGAWWQELRKQQGQPYTRDYEPPMYKAFPYGGFQIQAPPGVKVLLSFGGRTQNFYDTPGAQNVGLARARRLKTLLQQKYEPENPNFVYIDADALAEMPGRYVMNERTLNVYWEQYYKDAMRKAQLIIFLVDKAWLLSRNCFEELAWAQGKQLCTKHNEYPISLNMCPYKGKEFESAPFSLALAKPRIIAYLGQEALNRKGPTTSCPEQHLLEGFGDTKGQCMSTLGFDWVICGELTQSFDLQLQRLMDRIDERKDEWLYSRRLTTII